MKAVSRAAPRRASAEKRRRFLEAKPAWLAPEAGARAHARGRGSFARPAGRPARTLRRRGAAALRAPAPGNGAGGGFRTGRRIGMETFMPFWDVDLVEFSPAFRRGFGTRTTYRRAWSERRLRNDFRKQASTSRRKSSPSASPAAEIFDEAPDAWRALGGPTRLAELGIVEPKRLESRANEILDLAGDGSDNKRATQPSHDRSRHISSGRS